MNRVEIIDIVLIIKKKTKNKKVDKSYYTLFFGFFLTLLIKPRKNILNTYHICKNTLSNQQNSILETTTLMLRIIKILPILYNNNNLIGTHSSKNNKRTDKNQNIKSLFSYFRITFHFINKKS